MTFDERKSSHNSHDVRQNGICFGTNCNEINCTKVFVIESKKENDYFHVLLVDCIFTEKL